MPIIWGHISLFEGTRRVLVQALIVGPGDRVPYASSAGVTSRLTMIEASGGERTALGFRLRDWEVWGVLGFLDFRGLEFRRFEGLGFGVQGPRS